MIVNKLQSSYSCKESFDCKLCLHISLELVVCHQPVFMCLVVHCYFFVLTGPSTRRNSVKWCMDITGNIATRFLGSQHVHWIFIALLYIQAHY